MEYLGKVGSLFTSVSNFYSEINPATLSGAIDIVVVEQQDGDLACSPFHVRFGKLSVLMPQEKRVSSYSVLSWSLLVTKTFMTYTYIRSKSKSTVKQYLM